MTLSTTQRMFNFSAGPAVLPVSALEEAQRHMVCFPGGGASVMELSHRGKVIEGMIQEAEARLRRVMGIPEGYKVLFLQGGASLQFSMLPMNFLGPAGADYLDVGQWSKKAMAEAKKVGSVHVAWSGKAEGYKRMPKDEEIQVRPEASYLHVTSNETIEGIEFHREPVSHGVPMVCDASSDILSRPIDVSKYAMIYAGAQKNMGPAGVTVVVMSDEFYAKALEDEKRPTMLGYKVHVDNQSLYNTAPVFSIYMVGLVLKWLEEEMGGLTGVLAHNRKKADLLYAAIDGSNGFYRGHADVDSRSLMNITWRLPSEELEKQFVKEAEALHMSGLKGHRSVGGLRASIYNAFPYEGVEALVQFMADFQKRNG